MDPERPCGGVESMCVYGGGGWKLDWRGYAEGVADTVSKRLNLDKPYHAYVPGGLTDLAPWLRGRICSF